MSADRSAGRCALCATAIDAEVLAAWCAPGPPFCWKCGTFYSEEGNRWELTAAQAAASAAACDRYIDSLTGTVHAP